MSGIAGELPKRTEVLPAGCGAVQRGQAEAGAVLLRHQPEDAGVLAVIPHKKPRGHQRDARPLRAMPPIEKTRAEGSIPESSARAYFTAAGVSARAASAPPLRPPPLSAARPRAAAIRCRGPAPRSRSCPSMGRRARKSRFLPDPAAPAYRVPDPAPCHRGP